MALVFSPLLLKLSSIQLLSHSVSAKCLFLLLDCEVVERGISALYLSCSSVGELNLTTPRHIAFKTRMKAPDPNLYSKYRQFYK